MEEKNMITDMQCDGMDGEHIYIYNGSKHVL